MCGAEKVRHMLMGEQVLKKWKKSKKMTVAFGGILVMSVVIGGCGGREDAKKSIKIGISVYDQYDTFVSEMMKDFNDYATKKEEETGVAINIDTYNASASQSTQNSQVENMITEGCDVICVNLVDRTDPTAIIDLAEKNNIPVIFFNRELVEEDLERWTRLYYVGAQAFESGIMQGELAAEAFLTDQSLDKNGDGIFQYVVLEGEAGHQDAIVRTEYSVSTMIDSGVEVEKLGYAIANWNRAQAQTKMAQLMSQFGDSIELVIANNDDMALGAVDALDRLPLLLGLDGQPLHQRRFAAARPAFDEIHLHPRFLPKRLKIALEPGGGGGAQKEINRIAAYSIHTQTPHFCYRVCKNEEKSEEGKTSPSALTRCHLSYRGEALAYRKT